VAVEDELSDHRPRIDPTSTGTGPCVIKRLTGSTDANGYWFPANPEGDALNGRVLVLGAFVRNGANGVTRELTVQSVSSTFTMSPGPAGAVAFGLTVLVYMVLPQVAW
jgi:hypothetical protein